MSNGRFLFCQYADDVRDEVGGKISLIGLYQGGMNIAATPPVSLPKLAVVVNFSTPVDKPFHSIAFRVQWDDQILQRLELEPKKMPPLPPAAASRYGIQVIIVFQPLNVEKPGRLRVIAEVDGEEVLGNALQVQILDPARTAPAGGEART